MVRIWRFFGEFVDDRDATPPAARGSGSGSGAGAAIQGAAPLGGPTQEGQQEQENDDEGYMEPDVESIATKEG
jgi:hypothetical protein